MLHAEEDGEAVVGHVLRGVGCGRGLRNGTWSGLAVRSSARSSGRSRMCRTSTTSISRLCAMSSVSSAASACRPFSDRICARDCMTSSRPRALLCARCKCVRRASVSSPSILRSSFPLCRRDSRACANTPHQIKLVQVHVVETGDAFDAVLRQIQRAQQRTA